MESLEKFDKKFGKGVRIEPFSFQRLLKLHHFLWEGVKIKKKSNYFWIVKT